MGFTPEQIKGRMDKKVKQERTEPDHHRKIIIKGITVYPRQTFLLVGTRALSNSDELR